MPNTMAMSDLQNCGAEKSCIRKHEMFDGITQELTRLLHVCITYSESP